jgi:MFS family permease
VFLKSLASLTFDGWLLFGTRCLRLFAYGFLSVVLVLYLSAVGLSDHEIGALLTLTLLGDTAVSLWITTSADRRGRKTMLLAGAVLMILAGIVFALTQDFWVLLIAATIGVISPSGKEVGPFLSIEQAALSHIVPGDRRTEVFAWYNLVGSFATALGAFCGGAITQGVENAGVTGADVYRPVIVAYAAFGVLLLVVFFFLSPAVEVKENVPPNSLGLHRSRGVVLKLSALFALDAFGGGFIMDSIVAYWLHLRFGAEPITLGGIFFGANLFAGLSGLLAAWLARRFGLVNTMVFTHLPSNVLLLLIPLMPTLPLAITLLLIRFSISQMDVPTRQSYTMAVVAPDERSAASGVTGVARSLGSGLSPLLVGAMIGNPALMNLPFFLAGGLKIIYDLLLYRAFIKQRPSEET